MSELGLGHVGVVRLLLDRGADPNQARVDNGAVALLYATKSGSADIVRLLLERGADPNTPRTETLTPLIFAANQGNVVVAGLLATYGADLAATFPPNLPLPSTRTATAFAAGPTREFLELIAGWSAFKIGLATRDVAGIRSALELGRVDPMDSTSTVSLCAVAAAAPGALWTGSPATCAATSVFFWRILVFLVWVRGFLVWRVWHVAFGIWHFLRHSKLPPTQSPC